MFLALSLSLAIAAGQLVTPRPGAAPLRDDVKGTAVIRGRVVAADTGKPLRRAQVRISAPELPQGRTTSTTAQGVFVIRELPAGRYTVSVTRGGFLAMQYGQRRPGEPPRPLQVEDGQTLERVDFALPRAGTISGRITDEAGEAFAGVSVWPLQPQFFRGRRRLVPIVSSGITDDTGQYRVVGVPPGEYLVVATTRETWKTGGEKKEVLGYAPSFYPGVPAADAQRVKVGVAQQVSGIDFSLAPLRAATLSGTATASDGTPLVGRSVSVNQEVAGTGFSMNSSVAGAKVSGDGTWTVRDLPPGEYQLEISNVERGRAAESAFMAITVHGVDIEGIALVTDGGGTVAGQVLTEDGSPLPGATRLRVSAQRTQVDRSPFFMPGSDDNGMVGADGTFVFTGLVGPAIVRAGPLPAGWAIRSIDVNGAEHVDTPIEIKGGRRADGVRIVLTNRFPTLSGRVTDDRGQPADGTVLLFAADASKWLEAAGTTRSARPDQSGIYRFESVRPGEYYLVALEYVQQWQIADPEFLDDLRGRATRVTLGDTGAEVIDLKLR
jgi:hypothetical protein